MAYPIDRKLVVAVSTTALFDLSIEDKIFREEGVEKFKAYQKLNRERILEKGIAFPFVRRFLNINKTHPELKPVEVVILSRNNPESGVRAFNSIKQYGLDISRAVFTTGQPPYRYIPAFNVSLFLSTNDEDVRDAIRAKYPAGRILQTTAITDDESDVEFRIAFDFDGVLADDESDRVYQKSQQLEIFHKYETEHANIPLSPGLLADFFKKLSYFQKLETKKIQTDPGYKRILKTAIVTARNAPAHLRAIKTLESWDVTVNDLFLLGGIDKARILRELKPHLYIDDQSANLNSELQNIPLVHIPFGIYNEIEKEGT